MSDFSDNKSELDEYGVWVKKPPVENEITDTPAEEPVVDASFIEQAAASDQVIEQDLAEEFVAQQKNQKEIAQMVDPLFRHVIERKAGQ